MSLYNRVKDHLPETKGIISDSETLLINRRDFHLTQISAPHAVLKEIKSNIGYPYRVLISLLDQFSANLPGTEFNVVLTDQSLTIAAFYVWLRAGGTETQSKIYATQGIGQLAIEGMFLSEISREFYQCVASSPDSSPLVDKRDRLFTFVLGNTRTQYQTLLAVDRFSEVNSGLLVLKDYAKIDAFDEREYLESKFIFPAITFEGHAFCLKLG